jgi:hypothetical protein
VTGFVRIRSLDDDSAHGIKPLFKTRESALAKKNAKNKLARKPYTASDIKMLKAHSKARYRSPKTWRKWVRCEP